jgi:hypothetical protein
MVPTVKILGLKVRFGIPNEVKLLPAFLRCFPAVERLHIEVRARPLLHLALICIFTWLLRGCILRQQGLLALLPSGQMPSSSVFFFLFHTPVKSWIHRPFSQNASLAEVSFI